MGGLKGSKRIKKASKRRRQREKVTRGGKEKGEQREGWSRRKDMTGLGLS